MDKKVIIIIVVVIVVLCCCCLGVGALWFGTDPLLELLGLGGT